MSTYIQNSIRDPVILTRGLRYLQNTTGDIPPQLTLFCAVVATAADSSSHNVYIYGGYGGVDSGSTPSDDVYILSIPSFTWVKAYSGNDSHGRTGHSCIKVFPDQMFVLGGVFKSDPSICLDEGIIQVFNLNTLQFQTSYNSSSWQDYQVPSLVTALIGGGYVVSTSFNDLHSLTDHRSVHGSATKTSPNVWNDNALSRVFSSRYPKATPSYHAYATTTTSSSPPSMITTTPPKETESNGSGFPSWLGPTLGIVLGLVLVLAITAWCFRTRRRAHCRKTRVSSKPKTGKRDIQLDDLRRVRVASPITSELAANEKKWSMLATRPLVNSTAIDSPESTLPVPPESTAQPNGSMHVIKGKS